MDIDYISGDATRPRGSGPRVIAHVCNDLGKWGRGFVLAISRRWMQPEAQYRKAFSGSTRPQLGDVQFVEVEPDITVANLIGQHGIASRGTKASSVPPIRYEAVEQGLDRIAAFALERQASVHMPRIGAGLAGGDWNRIERLVRRSLVERGLAVSVYDLP